MSNGHENKQEEVTLVSLDPEEFDQVVKRVHNFLLKRVTKAKEKKDAKPSERAADKHVEAAKDVFVFVHMIELIEHMSERIAELQGIIAGEGPTTNLEVPEMFSLKKGSYLN